MPFEITQSNKKMEKRIKNNEEGLSDIGTWSSNPIFYFCDCVKRSTDGRCHRKPIKNNNNNNKNAENFATLARELDIQMQRARGYPNQ